MIGHTGFRRMSRTSRCVLLFVNLAKLRALNKLKETLHESTPMSMEEYRLRNQEELDTKTMHKKSVKAVTASSISDKGASVPSDSDVSTCFNV